MNGQIAADLGHRSNNAVDEKRHKAVSDQQRSRAADSKRATCGNKEANADGSAYDPRYIWTKTLKTRVIAYLKLTSSEFGGYLDHGESGCNDHRPNRP